MALAPADFYAYSRATGVPVPENPEERAALAPEVLEFRRNQLRAPQQESNPLAALGAAALGVGALVGGIAAAKGFRRADQAFTLPRPVTKAAGTQQDVRTIDAMGKRRAAERLEQEARQQRPEGIVLTSLPPANKASVSPATLPSAVGIVNTETKGYQVVDPWTAGDIASRSMRQQEPPQETYITPSRRQEVYEQVAAKSASEPPRVYRPKGGLEDIVSDPDQGNVLITDPNTGEIFMRGASPSSFAETYIRTEPVSEVTLQTLGALESGEDQMTGRTMRGVQRNEDLDASQVNQVARQTGNADVAASMTPDGVPVDQTEGVVFSEASATRFLQRERDEIASQLGEQGLLPTPSRVEAELANRLSGPEAWTYGSKYTQRKQALQLGATYDPRFFENLTTPSVTIAGEQIPTSSFFEPVAMEATAQRLQERVKEKKDWLGNIRLAEQSRQLGLANEIDRLAQEDIQLSKDIESLGNIPKVFSSRAEAEQAATQRAAANVALEQQDVIDARIDELQNKLFTSAKRVAGAERSTKEQIAGLTLPKKLKSGVEEGQRLFFQQDPETGEPIPATVELRSERRMIDTEEKGGGGRKVAEYVGGGGREEGIDLDVQNILEAAQTSQSPRYYEADQFGYTPDLEEGSFTSDRTQVGRVIDTEGVRLTNPPGRNPFEDLDTETLQQISLMGSKADSYNATKVLQRRSTPEGALRGLDVSRDIMRIKQSAPPERAQSLINQYIKNLQKF